MGNKSKRESRFNLLKLKDSDFESQDLNQRMASIEYLGDFINVRRVKKITLHICESKVPQFEKHIVKFFAKHGYKADISD